MLLNNNLILYIRAFRTLDDGNNFDHFELSKERKTYQKFVGFV